jgi:hypothetical protein
MNTLMPHLAAAVRGAIRTLPVLLLSTLMCAAQAVETFEVQALFKGVRSCCSTANAE